MKDTGTYEYTIKVGGMMCEHCARHVKEALLAIKGIESVDVSLENKNAKVVASLPIEEKELKNAIEDADYDYLGLGE